MGQGQYPVMLDRTNHRKIKLMAFEADAPMGGVVERLLKAIENRVQYQFEHDIALDGIECPDFLIFLGLQLVEMKIMKKREFEIIAKNPNLHDVFLTAFDEDDGREYLDKLCLEGNYPDETGGLEKDE